jgi:hypothetical protein
MFAELCGEGRLLGGAGGAAAAVGLDTEWAPPGSECAVLLQLASPRHCLLLRLGLLLGNEQDLAIVCGPASSLHALLSAPGLFLAGVGVTKDARLLADQYQLEIRGVVELAPLAQHKGAGLRTLCRTVLGRELPKVHSIRCGDWLARPLSEEQVKYAALDAEAGRQLLEVMCGGRRPDGSGSDGTSSGSSGGGGHGGGVAAPEGAAAAAAAALEWEQALRQRCTPFAKEVLPNALPQC